MNFRYFWFLSIGFERTYSPAKGRPPPPEILRKISEPPGSRICRRNILALGSILTLAGIADVNPHDLSVFGLNFSEGRGIWVLGAAAILAQIYWYVMRYQHVKEDGTVPRVRSQHVKEDGTVPRAHLDNMATVISEKLCLEGKPADLWANRAAALVTLLSWGVIAKWMFAPAA